LIANSRGIPLSTIIVRSSLFEGAAHGVLLSCDSAAVFDGLTGEEFEFKGMYGPV
jgi:hypothetical protein